MHALNSTFFFMFGVFLHTGHEDCSFEAVSPEKDSLICAFYWKLQFGGRLL